MRRLRRGPTHPGHRARRQPVVHRLRRLRLRTLRPRSAALSARGLRQLHLAERLEVLLGDGTGRIRPEFVPFYDEVEGMPRSWGELTGSGYRTSSRTQRGARSRRSTADPRRAERTVPLAVGLPREDLPLGAAVHSITVRAAHP